MSDQQIIRRELAELRQRWEQKMYDTAHEANREYSRKRQELITACGVHGHEAGEPDEHWPFALRCKWCGARIDG